MKRVRLLILFSFLLAFWLQPSYIHAADYTYTYSIDRSAVPGLYYNDLTYLIKVNQGSAVVSAGGQNLSFTYDAQTDRIMFTTPANNFIVTITNPNSTNNLGAIETAPLKDNKRWAWSHGMDDNVNLWCGDADACNSVAHFTNKGYRATVFMITKNVDTVTHDVNNNPAVRNESWILDEGQLQQLISMGWGIGNHDNDTSCSNSAAIAQANAILSGIVSRSAHPTYKLLTYANPNFSPVCDDLLKNAYGLASVDGGTSYISQLLMAESGNGLTDTITTESFFTGNGGVEILDSAHQIIKLYRESKGYDAVYMKARFDYMSANSSPTSHRWFNSLTHSDGVAVKDFVNYFDTHYGFNGTNEAWMATSDEVYSYILNQKYAVVTSPQSPTPTSGGPTPTPNLCLSIVNQSGLTEQEISLSGSHFGTVQGSSTLTILNQPAPIIDWRDTFIKARVPSGVTGTGILQLSSPECTTSRPFTVYSIDPTYLNPPASLFNLALGKGVYYYNFTSRWGGMENCPNTTGTCTLLTRNDRPFGGGVVEFDANGILALNLQSSLSNPVWFTFFNDTNWYPDSAGHPINYLIEGSTNSTNGQDGQWTTLLSITNNTRNSRTHQVNPQGNSWLRFRSITASGPFRIREIRVHTRQNPGSPSAPYSLAIFGDSNTAKDLTILTDTYFLPSVLSRLENNSNILMPYIIGMSGQNASAVMVDAPVPATSLATALNENPDIAYWAIALGTNDSNSNNGPWSHTQQYQSRVQQAIDQIKAHGKVPILARIPDTTATGYGDEDSKRVILTAIDQLNATNRLIPGPDFFTPFRYNIEFENATLMSDGNHHTDAGGQLVNLMWAQSIAQIGSYPMHTPTPSPSSGDWDGNGFVDIRDLIYLITHFNQSGPFTIFTYNHLFSIL